MIYGSIWSYTVLIYGYCIWLPYMIIVNHHIRPTDEIPGYPKVLSKFRFFESVVLPPFAKVTAPPVTNATEITFTTHSSPSLHNSGPTTTCSVEKDSFDLSTPKQQSTKSTARPSNDIEFNRKLDHKSPQMVSPGWANYFVDTPSWCTIAEQGQAPAPLLRPPLTARKFLFKKILSKKVSQGFSRDGGSTLRTGGFYVRGHGVVWFFLIAKRLQLAKFLMSGPV